MTDTQLLLKIKQLEETKEDLEEAIKWVEMVRIIFQKKLAALGEELKRTNQKNKTDEIAQEAEKLYQEYQKSLQIIEDYMDQTYQKVI